MIHLETLLSLFPQSSPITIHLRFSSDSSSLLLHSPPSLPLRLFYLSLSLFKPTAHTSAPNQNPLKKKLPSTIISMEDGKTSRASNNDQEQPIPTEKEPMAKNHPGLILPTPLKNIASRDSTNEAAPSSSSSLPSKTSQQNMPAIDTPNSQTLETQPTGVPSKVTSETTSTKNPDQGRTQIEGMSTKPRTGTTAARGREKAGLSGSSLPEPTPVAQSPRYPRRHKTRQTALANRSSTVGAASNPLLQNPSPTRRRQKQIARAKRANGEGGEASEAENTQPGKGGKEGEETTNPPKGRNDSGEPGKFFFTMKGPHEPGLKHLAAAIDPLPQAQGSQNQPDCPLSEDEANSDRTSKPEKGKGPENNITSQSERLSVPLSPLSILVAADHNTLQGEESNAHASGRSNEYDAANLLPITEVLASPQPVQAYYESDYPEMNTPEQLLLNLSQNPSPPMTYPQFRAMPVHQGHWYNYYAETQYTVYIWASGPWPPCPTTRWNRFSVTSSSLVTLLFEYIGRNRPDTGLVEIGGGAIAHYLGDVRRYGTRMDQTGWPTTLCLRPCERLPLGFSRWGDFMSAGMRTY